MIAAANGCSESLKAAQPAVNFLDPRLPASFWDKVSPCPMSGCWLWTGQLSAARGVPLYVRHSRREHRAQGGARSVSARRFAFDRLVGGRFANRLPTVCGVDICCNPSHTRQETPPEILLASLKKSASAYRRKNRDTIEFKRILKEFGLTKDDVERMLAEQANACRICRTGFDACEPRARRRGWNIDHDHSTGAVRSLLCGPCNRAVGLLRDSAERCRAAADYLERHAKGRQ